MKISLEIDRVTLYKSKLEEKLLLHISDPELASSDLTVECLVGDGERVCKHLTGENPLRVVDFC